MTDVWYQATQDMKQTSGSIGHACEPHRLQLRVGEDLYHSVRCHNSCLLHKVIPLFNFSATVASREIETTVFGPASQFLSNISRRAMSFFTHLYSYIQAYIQIPVCSFYLPVSISRDATVPSSTSKSAATNEAGYQQHWRRLNDRAIDSEISNLSSSLPVGKTTVLQAG